MPGPLKYVLPITLPAEGIAAGTASATGLISIDDLLVGDSRTSVAVAGSGCMGSLKSSMGSLKSSIGCSELAICMPELYGDAVYVVDSFINTMPESVTSSPRKDQCKIIK